MITIKVIVWQGVLLLPYVHCLQKPHFTLKKQQNITKYKNKQNETTKLFVSFSKCLPPFLMQALARLRIDYTVTLNESFSRTVCAASCTLWINSSMESIVLEYTNSFIVPQTKKSSGKRSGDRAGQATGPPLPIHPGKFCVSQCRTSLEKCGGAPSC